MKKLKFYEEIQLKRRLRGWVIIGNVLGVAGIVARFLGIGLAWIGGIVVLGLVIGLAAFFIGYLVINSISAIHTFLTQSHPVLGGLNWPLIIVIILIMSAIAIWLWWDDGEDGPSPMRVFQPNSCVYCGNLMSHPDLLGPMHKSTCSFWKSQ